jgi:hypothetical protein
MSQTNCVGLARTRNFARVLRAVGGWLDSHSSTPLFDPQQMSRELPQFSVAELSQAIACLGEDGYFKPVFAVRTPSGVIADEVFQEATQVPPKLRDRFDHEFLTEGSEIVPMFEFVKR